MINTYKIEKGTFADIDELEILYDELNDFLEAGVNYPGWIKGIYPTKETATQGVQEENLFVLRIDDVIAGSIILNHEPEEAYEQARWGINVGYEDVIVVRTLVVHPLFMKKGVASLLLDFTRRYSVGQGAKTIRLDVSINNAPAIAIYEKLGYKYVATVDLGLSYPHLTWFRLYEIVLSSL